MMNATLVQFTKICVTLFWTKTTIAWLLLCLFSFGAGYEVSQFRKEDEIKTRLYQVICRAMDDGLLTFNEEWMVEAEAKANNRL